MSTPYAYLPSFANLRYAIRYITKRCAFPALILLLLLSGCRTETPVYPDPEIRFDPAAGYLDHDTTLLLNDTVRIGLLAETRSDQELTHLHITVRRDTSVIRIDTALFTRELSYSRTVIKGIARSETWSFYVRDRDSRRSKELSITLGLDTASSWSPVDYIPSVVMGAQGNPVKGSFYSLATGRTYLRPEAFADPGAINLVYYYDATSGDLNTVASPGANIDPSLFPGPDGLSNWSIRNTTRFEYESAILPEEFDRCRNDSLVLAHTFDYETGKRKAKNLMPGQIYSFVTDSGRKGLFRVTAVAGQAEGTVELSIKMTRR